MFQARKPSITREESRVVEPRKSFVAPKQSGGPLKFLDVETLVEVNRRVSARHAERRDSYFQPPPPPPTPDLPQTEDEEVEEPKPKPPPKRNSVRLTSSQARSMSVLFTKTSPSVIVCEVDPPCETTDTTQNNGYEQTRARSDEKEDYTIL